MNWQIEFRPTDKLLLAVSGGVDSVVLAELCYRKNYRFDIAHVNFQLRAEESDADEEFVKTMGATYSANVFIKKANTDEYARINKLSIQVAAREIRYACFDELLQNNYDYLLTAHHRNDNIETVMMNFFRGTGVSGLRGMLPLAGKIARPLLQMSKEVLVRFAEENSLSWREDSSNASEKYSRNYFRHTIIPAIRQVFPEAEQNIGDNILRFREVEELYQQAIHRHKGKLLEHRGREVHIPVLKLKQARPLRTIVHEIIRDYHFTAHQVDEVIDLLEAEQSSYVQSATHRIIRNRNWLIIAANEPSQTAYIVVEKNERLVSIPGKEIRLNISTPTQASKEMEQLDLAEIQFPLIVRKWKQGDYFYPLGMKKKKKIARFLIDNKLSPTEKENTWVIESGKRICMILGRRIDDRFRITSDTTQALRITVRDSDRL